MHFEDARRVTLTDYLTACVSISAGGNQFGPDGSRIPPLHKEGVFVLSWEPDPRTKAIGTVTARGEWSTGNQTAQLGFAKIPATYFDFRDMVRTSVGGGTTLLKDWRVSLRGGGVLDPGGGFVWDVPFVRASEDSQMGINVELVVTHIPSDVKLQAERVAQLKCRIANYDDDVAKLKASHERDMVDLADAMQVLASLEAVQKLQARIRDPGSPEMGPAKDKCCIQ